MTGVGRGRALGRMRVWLTVLGLLLGGMAQAGNAVLIWPVDPVINAAQKAGELWVENRGASTTLIQVRVFGWQLWGGNHFWTLKGKDKLAKSPLLTRLTAILRILDSSQKNERKMIFLHCILDWIGCGLSKFKSRLNSFD